MVTLLKILYMLLLLGALCGLYFLLRNKSEKTKKTVVVVLMLLNVFQHFFKSFLYPQHYGEAFDQYNTAYNMCALLIIITPIIYFVGSELWKNFITYLGTVAAFVAMLSSAFIYHSWELAEWNGSGLYAFAEQFRYVFCHLLLFLTSALPALLGIYKINWRKCWKIPFVFILCLGILIVNNSIVYVAMPELQNVDLLTYLNRQNHCLEMHGPATDTPIMEFFMAFVNFFTPDAFEGLPILWFAVPLYFLILLCAMGLGAIFDHKRFMADLAIAKEKGKKIIACIKSKFKSNSK